MIRPWAERLRTTLVQKDLIVSDVFCKDGVGQTKHDVLMYGVQVEVA